MRLLRLVTVALGGAVVLLTAGILGNHLPLGDPPGIMIRIRTYLNTHQAVTADGSSFPELWPRYYAQGPTILFEKVREAVGSLPRWAVVDEDPARRHLHAVVSSALFGFEDDVLIRVVPEPLRPVVQVRATSRLGRGDFGANTRHILDFYAALESVGAHGARENPPDRSG